MKKLRGKHRITIVIIFTEMLNHRHTAIHVLIQLGSCQEKDDIPKGLNYKEFNEGTSYKGCSQRGQYKDRIRNDDVPRDIGKSLLTLGLKGKERERCFQRQIRASSV